MTMSKNTQIPKWLLKQEKATSRQWKARKRSQLKSVLLALHEYRMGCFYTPDGLASVGQIQEDLLSLQETLSVKKWGR